MAEPGVPPREVGVLGGSAAISGTGGSAGEEGRGSGALRGQKVVQP